ncbi:SRPBCC family protein, partial [Pseudomonas aeruginosa]
FLKHRVKANWKFILENECDGYHPAFVHTTAGARSKASPTTPPSPVGSGHAVLCGQQLAKPAAIMTMARGAGRNDEMIRPWRSHDRRLLP